MNKENVSNVPLDSASNSISEPELGQEVKLLEESTDLARLKYLITCTHEYEVIVSSEFISQDWKNKLLSLISDKTDIPLFQFKYKIHRIIEEGVSLFSQSQKDIFQLGALYSYITAVIDSHLRSRNKNSEDQTSGPPSTSTKALLFASEEGFLFSGIKKVPGQIPLAENVQEINIVDTHSFVEPQTLSKYSMPFSLAKQGFPRNIQRVISAEPTYLGVYSSFAPSYDSSYSHLVLQESHALESRRPEIKPDFDLLRLEGIDPEFLLKDAEEQELSEQLFSPVFSKNDSERRYSISSHLSDLAQVDSVELDPINERISRNASLLDKLSESQKSRLRYKDFNPRPTEIQLASEFLETTTQLISNLPPSSFISESSAERALKRFPYKEAGFKGSLTQKRPYAKSKRLWPCYTNN